MAQLAIAGYLSQGLPRPWQAFCMLRQYELRSDYLPA
jgi:hypothetical protein